MTERLISYSPEMVRAKRAGLKTMTRRIVKPQPVKQRDGWAWRHKGLNSGHLHTGADAMVKLMAPLCPYGVPGDILATREAWCASSAHDDLPPREIPVGDAIEYLADGEPRILTGRYRHARFMCRWMVRDRDELTAVRVERLQDISEEDAIAEGIERLHIDSRGRQHWRVYPHTDGDPREEVVTYCGKPYASNPIESYKSLWLSLNGAGSWDLNPWVWVLEFRRIES